MDQEIRDLIDEYTEKVGKFDITIITMPFSDPKFRRRFIRTVRKAIASKKKLRDQDFGIDHDPDKFY